MPEGLIPWRPRVLMPGRAFRLPVRADRGAVELDAGAFSLLDARDAVRDAARYYYLRAPEASGDYPVTACGGGGGRATVTIRVRTLDELRRPHRYNGAQWPRRWPLGRPWASVKRRQTLQDLPQAAADRETADWWLGLSDDAVWRQLPPAELPQAHFVNVHQGCPNCGTAIFQYGGFYPWRRSHRPCDFRSVCPHCGARYPGNDLAAGDFTSGDAVDDGFGYFDDDGHVYLFAATYHRDQVVAFDAGIRALTARLRRDAFDEDVARRLGVMLLRYAVDVLYVAAAPQYRYGPSLGEEEPWTWGQPDPAAAPDPTGALLARGMRRYCIDIPYVSESLALAYDTVWPLLREDEQTVSRARALGLEAARPEDGITLIEEMLAAQLQCILDRGARSNLPRESMGALTLLRGLDRPDAQDVMDWLYDAGPDRLRVFGVNDFFPDGSPPEATGVYNSIHADGLFALEYHLRQLRKAHPEAYPAARYPSLTGDPRAVRVIRQPYELTMTGRSWFQFGDGSAPGCKDQFGPGTMGREIFHAPLAPETLVRAAAYTRHPAVEDIRTSVREQRHSPLGTTVHDGVGIAILRTPEAPERAALGVVYGDATNHRHQDLLDVQLFAFGRPFLTDLGYPQSWATRTSWEGHWATHNTVWGVVPDAPAGHFAGRGRLIRTLFIEGLQILDLEAERRTWDEETRRWVRPGVTFRRLLALAETDGPGVAVVDLARIHGGTEHWRVCRGLEGTFNAGDLALAPQPGTVADPGGVRGDRTRLAHPDHAGLAWMDDVASTAAPAAWSGTWASAGAPPVHLDVHQIGVSASTTLMTARAAAVMGAPETSDYAYRTLLWRRNPEGDATCVDLVMEPRTDEATLEEARRLPVAEGAATAAGVALTTAAGRRITIYWAPESEADTKTVFADGAALHGPLAAVVDERVSAAGAARLERGGKAWRFRRPQYGRIVAVDRHACVLEVEGLDGIAPGDRIRVNPDGRGHNYGVENVEETSHGTLLLTLDVTSLLGRAPVLSVHEDEIELGMTIPARTGNLEGTRLVVEQDGRWAAVLEATNPEPGRTVVRIENPTRLEGPAPGTWVGVADGVEGDPVVFEPATCHGGSHGGES